MEYRYETHLHTHLGSRCGRASGKDYIHRYQDLGYTGIFVTDHFFGGNCAVDQSLPWHEQVDWYCSGYEDALEEGEKCGFQVLFGWEQNYNGDEYLIYGLDKNWLYQHPEVKKWTYAQQFSEVHKYGGCVIQAHPFRDRAYIDKIRLNPENVDGVEVFNAQNPIYVNALGLRYCRHLKLPMTCGSDIHTVENWEKDKQNKLAGIAFNTPLKDEKDFAARILSGIQPVMKAPIHEMESFENPEEYLREGIEITVLSRDGNISDTDYHTLLV